MVIFIWISINSSGRGVPEFIHAVQAKKRGGPKAPLCSTGYRMNPYVLVDYGAINCLAAPTT